MQTLNPTNDTSVNQTECQNLSPEENKIIQEKWIVAETCAQVASLARATLLSAGVLLGANQALAQNQDASPSHLPVVPENIAQSEKSAYFFHELKRLGIEVNAQDIAQVLSAHQFEKFATVDEKVLSLKELWLDTPFTSQNITQKITHILQIAGIASLTQENWKTRLSEMTPNDDEAELLNIVVQSIPKDQFTASGVATTLTSVLSIHKTLQDNAYDGVKKLNLLADIHNVIRGLWGDVSQHVRLYMKWIDGKELSYTLFLPTEMKHMAEIAYYTWLDLTPAFQKYVEEAQKEFVVQAKKTFPRIFNERIDSLTVAWLEKEWFLTSEIAKIGYQNAQNFVQAYSQLSSQEQSSFFSSVTTGNTPAHRAFQRLNQEQQQYLQETWWTLTAKVEMRVLADIIFMYASLPKNIGVLKWESEGAVHVKDLSIAKETWIASYFYDIQEISHQAHELEEAIKKADQEKQQQLIAQYQARIDASQARIDASQARIDASQARIDANIREAAEKLAATVRKLD